MSESSRSRSTSVSNKTKRIAEWEKKVNTRRSMNIMSLNEFSFFHLTSFSWSSFMHLIETYCYFQSSQLIIASIHSMDRVNSKQNSTKSQTHKKETTCRTGNNQEPFNQSSCCSVNAIPVALFCCSQKKRMKGKNRKQSLKHSHL